MSTSHAFTGIDYEQGPRATAVDAYASLHLLSSNKPINKALEHALQNSVNKGLPDIACYPMQGKFLAVQCRIAGARNRDTWRVLEHLVRECRTGCPRHKRGG